MVELYHSKSPLLSSLELLKIQPETSNVLSFYSPNLSKLNPRSLHLVSTIAPNDPSFPPKSIRPISTDPSSIQKIIHGNTRIFSTESSTNSDCSLRGIHPISTKPMGYPKFPPKPTKSLPSTRTHSVITKSTAPFKFRQRPTNFFPMTTNPATMQVLAQIFKLGPFADIVAYTILIKFLGDSGHAAEALELFNKMRETHQPDIISFTVIIRILIDFKMVDQAFHLLHEMPSYDCKPDTYCYNTLIDKLGEAGHEEHVQELWSKMKSDGINPDVVTYSSLVKSQCATKKIDEAILVLECIEKSRTIKPNTYVYNTIIKAYLDLGQIKEALGVLGRMMVLGCIPDLCSFNLFIKYYSDIGEGLQAYVFLKWMSRSGIEASESSYRICIYGLIKQGKVFEVIDLVKRINKSCVTVDTCTWNKLIKWLDEVGRWEEAYGVFLGLKEPDEITMNIVIQMLYKHGRGQKAWEVFNLMKERKIEASVVTYNILVHWLGREEKVSEAFKLVNQMETEQRLSPDVITYNCLLDGLCNIGEVDEACRLILAMFRNGCKPDLVSFNTLINGMINIGRTDDASRLFEHMRGKLAAHSIPLEKLVNDILTRQ
ncbi:PREDICTED: pentatricopeptide repeat-containing protein At4g31850, chloroplastic [Nelumbo nucifera]|uniref:Uncharacterized protein n=2 Tax=Nelumbo nucifera TaxID=4432 RepID=A0A822Z0T7_NELNU|nr:PREDICTED: pentatricopeptide repeat-containing protein At4g31850, chloroplastic [Nelumbo nucifera]DAD37281.1 TPA_asm: hypothetical protein HUJ06_007922 [Nelumbo nucifera]